MTTKLFALEPGGAPRVKISWRWRFRDLTVKVDGIEIGRIRDAAELKAGRDFALADGSVLRVQLNTSFHTKELIVTRNGEPLPGSSTHPRTIHRTAYGALYAMAGLTAVIGVLALITDDKQFGGQAGGVFMLLVAAIITLLAWRVQRFSVVALYVAIALLAIDTVFSLMEANVHGIIIRILLFAALIRAIPVIKQLRSQEQRPAVPA